jgi:Spy/CpxP family protein refolding chaperone
MSDGRLSPTRTSGATRTKLGAMLAAVFLLGVVTGGASWHVLSARAQIDMFDAAHAGARHGVFVWSLERKLDLSASQKQRIEQILADYDRATDAVRRPVDPRIAALKAQMRSDVRATLTPEQQMKYDVLIAELDAARGRGRPSAVAPGSVSTPASSATP